MSVSNLAPVKFTDVGYLIPHLQKTDHRTYDAIMKLNNFCKTATQTNSSNIYDTIANQSKYNTTLYAQGSLYVASDTSIIYVLSGTKWKAVTVANIVDTHAHRASYNIANYPNGSTYFESDTNLTYRLEVYWQYFSGIYSLPQANISAYAATLTNHDAGTLIFVNDYYHTLVWLAGGSFTFNNGEINNYIQGFMTNPGNGWVPLNGSSVHYLLPTGALSSLVTLVNNSGLLLSTLNTSSSYSLVSQNILGSSAVNVLEQIPYFRI